MKRNKKLIALVVVLFLYICLVTVLFINKQQQDIRSRGNPTTSVTFEPSTNAEAPLIKGIGETTPLDIIINPGENQVSTISLDIQYDPAKVSLDETQPIVINTTALPQIFEGPVVAEGRLRIKLGVGSDPTKAIREPTKIGTVHFITIGETGTTPTEISIHNESEVLSLGENDNPTENVLAGTSPAFVMIEGELPTSCKSVAADTMLIVDASGSMVEPPTADNLEKAQAAAKRYVDIIAQDSLNRIGLVTFAKDAQLESALTDNFAAVKNKIDGIETGPSTCTKCGMEKANLEIQANGRDTVKQIAVLLTDGLATEPGTNAEAEAAAIAYANTIKNTTGMPVYTIGLGQNVNQDFLEQIATITGGKYFFSPTADDLQQIYEEIAETAGRGSVTGFVFNDKDGDGIRDSNEEKLSGWTIELRNAANTTTLASLPSDGTGTYKIDKLCNNTAYNVRLIQKNGWEQTKPKNPAYYPITISNANNFESKDFGVRFAPSPTPSNTKFIITVSLHGIGSSGDNMNPTASNLSNKTPLHPDRPLHLLIYDRTNTIAATVSGVMKYDAPSGTFKGVAETASPKINTGSYIIKTNTDRFLRKRISVFEPIIAGQTNTLTPVTLVNGDFNSDNRLNIVDYNAVIDCYSDTQPARNCSSTRKIQTDFDDDGKVNQRDYNLFLRELSVQNGD